MGYPDRPAKVSEIGAAPHADVLTGINELLAIAFSERARSPTEPRPSFQNTHTTATLGKGLSCCQAGEAAPDDQHLVTHAPTLSRQYSVDSIQ
jgi:hypothetical protein